MRNTLLISGGFFTLFFGFTSAQQYLLVVLERSDQANVALLAFLLLYGTFAISGLGAAKLITAMGGLKKSMIVGACTYALFVASIAIGNTPLILACATIMGVGATLIWVPSGQIIVGSSLAQVRGRNLSFQTVSLYAGSILGVWVGGFLYESVSIVAMYSILAATALLSLPFFLLTKPPKTIIPHLFRPQFFFDYRILLLVPIIAGTYFLQGQTFTAMNLIVISAVGASALPLVISVVRLFNMAGSLGGGTLSDHMNKGVVLGGLTVAALAGTLLFSNTDSLFSLLVGATLIGVSISSIYPICLSWLREKVPEEEYLDALGIFHVYTNIGTLLAITANMWLPATVSFTPAVIALLVGLPCIVLFHRLANKST